jgi:hypothetical protein
MPERAVLTWQARWEATDWLQKAIAQRRNELKQQAESLAPGAELRIPTLTYLLRALEEFGRQQFFFFLHGLARKANYLLEPAPDSKLVEFQLYQQHLRYERIDDYILNIILDRIAYDLQVIDRVVSQRFAPVTSTPTNNFMADTAYIADRLAMDALLLVNDTYELEAETTALTYLNTHVNVRVVPYAPVALIGVPVTASPTTPQDFLAIAHEVGHYVYWRGLVNDGGKKVTLRQKLAHLPHPLRQNETLAEYPWLEEIVADIFCCLIAGPAAALSMQERCLTYLGDRFTTIDEHHPAPAIRPFLYTYVLDELGQTPIKEKLENHWKETLQQKRSIGDIASVPALRSNIVKQEAPHLGPMLAEMKQVAGVVLDELQINQRQVRPWSAAPVDLTDLFTLYDRFEERIRWPPASSAEPNILAEVNGKLQAPDGTLKLDIEEGTPLRWRQQVAKLLGGEPDWLAGLPADLAQQTQTLAEEAPKSIPAQEWLPILDFGGWTDEVGNGRPHK